jgi:hypothetical protein
MTILRCGLAAVGIITAITVAKAADVPDALSVEW